MENGFFEKTCLKQAQTMNDKYGSLPKMAKLCKIKLTVLLITAPLIVTIPVLGIPLLVFMYKFSLKSSELFNEIGIIKCDKQSRRLRRNSIGSLLMLIAATILFAVVIFRHDGGFDTMFLTPFSALPLLCSFIFVIWMFIVARNFYAVDYCIDAPCKYLKENLDKAQQIKKFRKDNESILSKYDEIQNKSEQYTEAHKDVFDDYFKIMDRGISLLNDIDKFGSPECIEMMNNISEEMAQHEARYPEIFGEYRKIQSALDSLPPEEKEIISDYDKQKAELEAKSDYKKILIFHNEYSEEATGDVWIGFLFFLMYFHYALRFVLNMISAG